MAIEAKQTLLNMIENGCADLVTVRDMPRILSVINDVLEKFDVKQLETEEEEYGESDMVGAFIASMKVQGRSPKTIARYRYIIGKFMDHAKVSTRKVNVYHIRSWIADEQSRGIQNSTLEGDRQVLSSFFGWLHREGLIDKNPVVNVGTIKVAKKLKKAYSGAELERLNQACENVRDRAIMHFLRSTGCRISEATGLNRDAVDFEKMECVVHGKGNKDRRVYLDDVAGMVLREYLESRTDDNPALFIGKRHERLQPGGVRIMLKQLGKRARVENVHPHRFRRTRATILARHGMQVQEISFIMGHANISTTMMYVVKDEQDVRSNFRRLA